VNYPSGGEKVGSSQVMQSLLGGDKEPEFYVETNGKPLEGFKQSSAKSNFPSEKITMSA
jgi:hypothetical protein